MSAWDDLLKHIRAGDVVGTIRLVGELGPAERKVVAAELPTCLTARSRGVLDWREWDRQLRPLLMAGAGSLSGASAVTGWLLRRDFRWQVQDRVVGRVLELLRRRPVDWQADVALRLAGRLRHADVWPWAVAAALVRETGVRPPDSDPFMTGWLRELGDRTSGLDPAMAAGDPLLAAYGPRLFEIDGLGLVDVWRVVEGVVRLLEHGLLDRAAVIDGLLGRLLRDGPAALTPLVGLHDRLDLDLDEAAERARDYARLLPAGPVAVADLALAQLRRLEEAGRLEEELFGEALEALAFRPEKKLLRAAISWAGDAVLRLPPAGGAPRVDTVLRAMAMIFAQDTLALQERAVRLAVKLAPRSGADGREAVRDAAAGLPAELREKVSAAYGGGIAAGEVPVTPLSAVQDGRRIEPPFGSVEELAHAVTVFSWPPDPYDFERLLAGLAEWSHRAPEALRTALRPWWHPFDPHVFGHYGYEVHESVVEGFRLAFLAFASPQDSVALSRDKAPRRSRPSDLGALDELYLRRARELAACLLSGGGYPVILATPTAGTGHVDPGVLLDRIERLEAAGVDALPGDLAQALLRLPRTISAADLARAGRLSSPAGQASAAWMRGDRPADPTVTVSVGWHESYGGYGWHEVRAHMAVPVVGELFREVLETRPGYSDTPEWWPPALPSHREIVAAHLLGTLVSEKDGSGGHAQVLASLAQGDGPLGDGMAYALACGMGHAAAADRAGATDALLTLAARGEVPAEELAQAVTTLVTGDVVKLNRVVSALDDATQAGAHEAVWEVVVRLLPGLLPQDGERPRAGLADLLAAGARAARIAGVRAKLPEVAMIAARKGSSRLIQEARRLIQLVRL
ncbi:hypothetical protein EDD27_3811 [Nonomuraea polychroma]|uniref:Secreted protein n=1 Tax=Nonomuraea polychroma TaxID=46176 RepID=A0A438M6G9_9ACTN|nr:DUF6493 family protein [Nonomuraea polychroma]RVX41303.1 hypothetical protein EDD27_3811 [Nonomuraea polychroma]